MWFNETKIDQWRNAEIIEEQPTLTYDDNLVVSEMGFENIFIYGMQYTSLFMFVSYYIFILFILFLIRNNYPYNLYI